jgi:hypothetical protein
MMLISDRIWMQILIEVAGDWNRTFCSVHKRYCSRQYWYLFTAAAKAHLAREPFTLGRAIKAMTSGSNKTRESRIGSAIGDGLLEGCIDPKDKRKKLIVPSERLLALLAGHHAKSRHLLYQGPIC